MSDWDWSEAIWIDPCYLYIGGRGFKCVCARVDLSKNSSSGRPFIKRAWRSHKLLDFDDHRSESSTHASNCHFKLPCSACPSACVSADGESWEDLLASDRGRVEADSSRKSKENIVRGGQWNTVFVVRESKLGHRVDDCAIWYFKCCIRENALSRGNYG